MIYKLITKEDYDRIKQLEKDFPQIEAEHKEAVEKGSEKIKAYVISKDSVKEIELMISELTNDEKNIILDGCLINYYRNRN